MTWQMTGGYRAWALKITIATSDLTTKILIIDHATPPNY